MDQSKYCQLFIFLTFLCLIWFVCYYTDDKRSAKEELSKPLQNIEVLEFFWINQNAVRSSFAHIFVSDLVCSYIDDKRSAK